MNIFRHIIYIALLLAAAPQATSCGSRGSSATQSQTEAPADTIKDIIPGAARADIYTPLLKGKRVALLSNHTGTVGDRHTLDVMLENGINVTTLLSPEHGFRGTADAGQHVKSGIDEATGLPVKSLYSGGKRGIPDEVMDSIDAIVVDLQDVGTRFYTYHITMIEAMEAAARHGKKVIVLDRPNPLGMTVDGPVLDMKLRSGVGRIPVPVLHGMTMGEIATMANGEGWLKNGDKADLTVIPVENYTHASRYTLPQAPSPNLRDMTAIYLYPSLCYFEGTTASVGRGTDFPFMAYGHPAMRDRGFSFTPKSVPGAKNPPLLGKLCHGVDLRDADVDSVISAGVDLSYIIDAYNNMTSGKATFFNSFFDKLIGNDRVRPMIVAGKSASEIKATWQDEVNAFKTRRQPYLLYPLQ
ncbi:MAG: DUF1343 domain-containing protein [Lachnospiraceae bacterium]|nr:DUF1343 domain-containing protein [Lachnospiraceae bacterium]